MGSNSAKQDDEQPLVDDYIQMYEKLKLVIIGCHGAGKNDVGNTILGKTAFSWWKKMSKKCKKGKCKTLQGKVTVYRAPGWRENESPNQITQRNIRKCLRDVKPHAVILVIRVPSSFTKITPEILENIFDKREKFWDHTIVMFTSQEMLDCDGLDDYIKKYSKLHEFFPNEHKWKYIFNSNDIGQSRSKLLEILEDMITEKNCMYLSINSDGGPEEFIAPFKERISQLEKALTIKTKLVTSQKRTIKKLKKKLKEKEGKLEEKPSVCLTCPRHQKQIEELQKENEKLKQEIESLIAGANKRELAQHFAGSRTTPNATKTPTKKDTEMDWMGNRGCSTASICSNSNAKEHGKITNPSFNNSVILGPVSVNISQ